MALVVTVGSASADSYASLAELEAYAVAQGQALAGTAAELEAALRRAASYLDAAYDWRGVRADATQARAWPRSIAGYDRDGYAIDATSIPQRVKDAQCELAIAFRAGTDPWAVQSLGAVARKRVKAGPVETETEYQAARLAPVLPAVNALLRDYATGTPSGARMVRG